ncbi:MFS transporter [Vagococcus teuberi]|uniref:Multidrug MFS transporter n=1 Tax=Vagococcus teuberi TaxID=519472 RepID=A0A1J0A4A0_9ENTE|nr:MFS transporter [Vagococcus teuberi]APB30750.1 multidrug MFS transporter [Vagococcus teuberi]
MDTTNQTLNKNRWLVLVAIGLFTFMSTLDGSIVNIALPVMSKDMRIPMNQTEWIVSIYLMTVCACLPLFGKIGDSIGKIKIFRIGTLTFVIGSLLCGVTHTFELLLFSRIIQAIGASMTMSTNTGIITEVFPISERGRALGMIGAFVSLGSIMGPGLGGVILAKFTWEYIFLINVPVGLLTIILGQKVLPKDSTKSGNPIDFLGFLLFAATILTLFGGIFIGQELGYVHTLPIILIIIALMSMILFYRVEINRDNPLIQFSLFKNKVFTLSLLTASMIFVTNFFTNVVIPFYLQNTRGYSASFSGLLMMVIPFTMIVGSPVSGYITDKIGAKLLTFVGLILITISQVLYLVLGQQTSLIFFVFASIFVGLGNALFQAPNNTLVMSNVEKKDLGVAGSLNSLARNLGMVIGISLSTTVLYAAMSHNYGQKVTTYISGRPDVFIYGMHAVYMTSFVICLIATILTGIRFFKKIN